MNTIQIPTLLIGLFFLSSCSSGSGGGSAAITASEFCGGSGSLSDPYLICNEAGLKAISSYPSASYKLNNNVTLSNAWVSIPSFSGVFDGNSKTISNIKTSKDTGLSNYIGGLFDTNTGTIKNFSAAIVSGSPFSYSFGGLVGKNGVGGFIDNINISGSINSLNPGNQGSSIGAIAGSNSGTISNITSSVSITSSFGEVGGIVGSNLADGGFITKSFVSSSVALTVEYSGSNPSQQIGGIAGYSAGSISSVEVQANINTIKTNVGGIVGFGVGNISGATFSGSINASDAVSYVGGIVGLNGGSIIKSTSLGDINAPFGLNIGGIAGRAGNISYSHSSGNITGGGALGGLTGYHQEGAISNSYSTSNLIGGNTTENYTGGLVGFASSPTNGWMSNCYFAGAITSGYRKGGIVGSSTPPGSVTSAYWDQELTGISSSIVGLGKATAQMKTAGTFAGWNFTTIWEMSATTGYPVFK